MPDAELQAAGSEPRATQRRDIRERMERARIASWQPGEDPDLAVFSIEREDGAEFPKFQAGQYLLLALRDQPADDPRPRQFSIASSPRDRHHLEFYVILVHDELDSGGERRGTFTGTLWQKAVGDEILYMQRPAGRFTLARTPQREVICIATGTGLAPFVAMAREMWQTYRETGHVDRRLTIVHCVSYASQLGYRSLLEEMAADEGFGLLYLPGVSRPGQDDGYAEPVCRGRANDLVRLHFDKPMSGRVEPWVPAEAAAQLRERFTRADAAIYLCGNPGMIADASEVLGEAGYVLDGRDAQVITEDYW